MSTSMIRRSASSRRFDGTARALAVAGLVAAAGFVAVLVAVGLLDDGYSQRSEGISALGSRESDTAGLMILGFLLLGSIALTSGAALLRSLPGKAGEAAGVLVVLAGALTVVCGSSGRTARPCSRHASIGRAPTRCRGPTSCTT